MMEIVVAEIMQDKVYLDVSGQLAVADAGSPDDLAVAEDAGPSLDDL